MVAMPNADDADAILLRDDRDGVTTLTLNRPKARNALSFELLDALQQALDDIREQPAIRVVVLTANGPVFCAGHDMKQLRQNRREEYYQRTFQKSSGIMMSLMGLPQPVIARVQGPATAAGTQLIGSCDLAVAVDSATFATPGVQIGLFCSTPMVALSRNIGRKPAMEMLLVGEPIDAEEAVRHGLINKAVAADALDGAIAYYTDRIVAKSPHVLRVGKEAFYRQLEQPVADAYAYAAAVMARNMMADDAAEGIDAFLEKRAPAWVGH